MPNSTVWVWEEVKRTFSQCKRVVLTARSQLPVKCTQYLTKDQFKSTAKEGRKETASPWTLRPGIECLYHQVMRAQVGMVGDGEWYSQTPYIPGSPLFRHQLWVLFLPLGNTVQHSQPSVRKEEVEAVCRVQKAMNIN